MSTVLSFPDARRAAAERELIPLARAVAIEEIAADVAHDVANPLFAMLGLVELLLEDAAAGSEEAASLQMLQATTLELRQILQALLDVARPSGDDAAPASLQEAARRAVGLLTHGVGRSLEIDERYPDEPEYVPCAPDALVLVVLSLLLAARGSGTLRLEVSGPTLRIAPLPETTLGSVAAARIVVDSGGTVEPGKGSLTLRWSV